MKYMANNIQYKFVEEDDNWITIYKWDTINFKWIGLIQAMNIEKAKEFCDLRAEPKVPLQKLVN